MRETPLTNGGVALVDDEDYERLAQDSWHQRHGYAIRCVTTNGKRHTIYMHREVLGDQVREHVDHRNGTRLDNRKSNLRGCSHAENHRNSRKFRRLCTSRFKGVRRGSSAWEACIGGTGRGKTNYLGSYQDEVAAALAYDAAARERFGEFARLNFPNAGEQSALL